MDGWTPWGIKHRVTRVLPHDVHAMSFKVSMPAMCAFLAQMSIRYACEGHADSKDFPRVYSRFNMSVLNTLKWWVKHHVACPHFRDPVFVWSFSKEKPSELRCISASVWANITAGFHVLSPGLWHMNSCSVIKTQNHKLKCKFKTIYFKQICKQGCHQVLQSKQTPQIQTWTRINQSTCFSLPTFWLPQ